MLSILAFLCSNVLCCFSMIGSKLSYILWITYENAFAHVYILYLSSIYQRYMERIAQSAEIQSVLGKADFVPGNVGTTLCSDCSWWWFRCMLSHTFWQEIHCTTTISTELQQLHPGAFQWGYLASVLQCLAQTSTFTLDIDANVKSLGAIGQALQKVMKDLRSETRQHPIQHRERFPIR